MKHQEGVFGKERQNWLLIRDTVNLPIGAMAFLVIAFFLPKSTEPSSKLKNNSWWEVIKCFDPIGTAILIPSIICLLLALQWGGTQYPWNSTHVIATFTCFGVSFIAWVIIQCKFNAPSIPFEDFFGVKLLSRYIEGHLILKILPSRITQ